MSMHRAEILVHMIGVNLQLCVFTTIIYVYLLLHRCVLKQRCATYLQITSRKKRKYFRHLKHLCRCYRVHVAPHLLVGVCIWSKTSFLSLSLLVSEDYRLRADDSSVELLT